MQVEPDPTLAADPTLAPTHSAIRERRRTSRASRARCAQEHSHPVRVKAEMKQEVKQEVKEEAECIDDAAIMPDPAALAEEAQHAAVLAVQEAPAGLDTGRVAPAVDNQDSAPAVYHPQPQAPSAAAAEPDPACNAAAKPQGSVEADKRVQHEPQLPEQNVVDTAMQPTSVTPLDAHALRAAEQPACPAAEAAGPCEQHGGIGHTPSAVQPTASVQDDVGAGQEEEGELGAEHDILEPGELPDTPVKPKAVSRSAVCSSKVPGRAQPALLHTVGSGTPGQPSKLSRGGACSSSAHDWAPPCAARYGDTVHIKVGHPLLSINYRVMLW